MVETKQTEERVILVAVRQSDDDNTDRSLDELEELASTAGAVTVTRIIQNREAIHPGTYVGKGKIEEIRDAIYMYDATGIICDDELSPAQMTNLEEALEVKIMDRTLVILDIFAARANTGEGKIIMEFEKLQAIIAEVLNTDPDSITMESTFVDDLGADSLDVFQIISVNI